MYLLKLAIVSSFFEFISNNSYHTHLFLTFYIAVNSFLIFSLPTQGHIQTRKCIKWAKTITNARYYLMAVKMLITNVSKKQPCVRLCVLSMS